MADARAAATPVWAITLFSTSFAQAMWYQAGAYVLVLALLFRLPKVNPRQLAELDDILGGAAAE